jgi:hypothetical protein
MGGVANQELEAVHIVQLVSDGFQPGDEEVADGELRRLRAGENAADMVN